MERSPLVRLALCARRAHESGEEGYTPFAQWIHFEAQTWRVKGEEVDEEALWVQALEEALARTLRNRCASCGFGLGYLLVSVPMHTLVYRVFYVLDSKFRSDRTMRKRSSDKEFFFQEWFSSTISEDKGVIEKGGYVLEIEPAGRNSYPDFYLSLKAHSGKEELLGEGYELKALALNENNRARSTFDANSQIPKASFKRGDKSRHIFYIFCRYHDKKDSAEIVDLVIAHGELFNVDYGPAGRNKGLRGAGNYGDILVRLRNMYVPPTPYALLDGLENEVTLVVPESLAIDLQLEADDDIAKYLVRIGEFSRKEASQLLIGYEYDIIPPQLGASQAGDPEPTEDPEPRGRFANNPRGNLEHKFIAYSTKGERKVSLKQADQGKSGANK